MLRRDRQHQDVDVARADFPVRRVEAKVPGIGQAKEPHDQARRPVLGKADVLEEALQTSIGRGNQNGARALAGNPLGECFIRLPGNGWLRFTVRALITATIRRHSVVQRALCICAQHGGARYLGHLEELYGIAVSPDLISA